MSGDASDVICGGAAGYIAALRVSQLERPRAVVDRVHLGGSSRPRCTPIRPMLEVAKEAG